MTSTNAIGIGLIIVGSVALLIMMMLLSSVLTLLSKQTQKDCNIRLGNQVEDGSPDEADEADEADEVEKLKSSMSHNGHDGHKHGAD